MSAITTFDNAPPPAEWVTPPGFICGGCSANANSCADTSRSPIHEPCCRACTHCTEREPIVWHGDDA